MTAPDVSPATREEAPMTDVQAETLDLEAIRARCEAATEGPWRPTTWGEWLDDGGWGRVVKGDVFDSTIIADSPCRAEDVRFIAAARSDVPALVAEVERLRAKVEAVRAIAESEGYATWTKTAIMLRFALSVPSSPEHDESCCMNGINASAGPHPDCRGSVRAALASHDGKDGQK